MTECGEGTRNKIGLLIARVI